MGLWSALGASSASSAANSAAGSLGSSFGASVKGYGQSNASWFDPLGKGLANLWSGWQQDEDAYADERAYNNAVRLLKKQYDMAWDYNTAMARHIWDSYQSPLAQRVGLEQGGFNPLLAVDSVGGSPSGAYGSLSVQPFTGESSLSKYAHGDSVSAYTFMKEEKRIKEATLDNLKAELGIKQATAANIFANTAKTVEESKVAGRDNPFKALVRIFDWAGDPKPLDSAKGKTIGDYADKFFSGDRKVIIDTPDNSAKSHQRSINDYHKFYPRFENNPLGE